MYAIRSYYAPDAGGVERARAFAKRLQANLAIIDKRREGPNQAQIMNIIGDVQGKSVLLLDDMIDTAGTIVQGAQACADQGAREVWTACTHAVLSGPALVITSYSIHYTKLYDLPIFKMASAIG